MSKNGNHTVNRLALIGIPMAVFVLGLKILAWWVTGSVALLSDALESIVNVVAAVQFHPESIMTLGGDAGMRMIENVVAHLSRKAKTKAA